MSEKPETEKPEKSEHHFTNVVLKLSKGDLAFELSSPNRDFVRQLNNSLMSMQALADALTAFGATEKEVTQVSASYQVQSSDTIIFVNAVSGDVTISLLSVGVAPVGSRLLICRLDDTDHNVTLTPVAGETIEGASSLALTAQYQKALLVNGGSTWLDERGSELI